MNYFELFDLSQAPSVDKSMLARKYFELQRENHPDFFTRGTDEEKEQALEQSASINKAFQIFQNDERTIEYFLQTIGMIEADEKYSLPPDFLMEMMEINEALVEDKESATKQVAENEEQLLEEIKPIINAYNASTTDKDALMKLKEYYYKKKYLKRILDRLGD